MKHWRKALAALLAVALLTGGMAMGEAADEATFLGVWSMVEASKNGRTYTAEDLEHSATVEIEPGTAAFSDGTGTGFFSTRIDGDALVLENQAERAALRIDGDGLLYMSTTDSDGATLTLRFEKLEDYDSQAVEQEAEAQEAATEADRVDALLDSLGIADGGQAEEDTLNQLESEMTADSNGSQASEGAQSGSEVASQLLAMCKESTELYKVSEYPDQDWALISSVLPASDRAFVHKYESSKRYSTTTFFLTVEDYQSATPHLEPELMVSYCRDDKPLNYRSVTLAFGGRSFTFSGDLGYNVDQDENGYSEYVHIRFDQQNMDFIAALAQYVMDLDGELLDSLPQARAQLILHGDEDVETELGEGFFLDFFVTVVNALGNGDGIDYLYENGGTTMREN